jgi:hypothetical protein
LWREAKHHNTTASNVKEEVVDFIAAMSSAQLFWFSKIDTLYNHQYVTVITSHKIDTLYNHQYVTVITTVLIFGSDPTFACKSEIKRVSYALKHTNQTKINVNQFENLFFLQLMLMHC